MDHYLTPSELAHTPTMFSTSTPGPTGSLTPSELRLSTPTATQLQQLTISERMLFQELWSKVRWAIGSTFSTTYLKKSQTGQLAYQLALLCWSSR